MFWPFFFIFHLSFIESKLPNGPRRRKCHIRKREKREEGERERERKRENQRIFCPYKAGLSEWRQWWSWSWLLGALFFHLSCGWRRESKRERERTNRRWPIRWSSSHYARKYQLLLLLVEKKEENYCRKWPS